MELEMNIQPKIRGFICTTAHPLGCSRMVEEQINFAKINGQFQGPKRVLVIGGSTGYGLASRIAATFGGGAGTIGVFFEKEAENNLKLLEQYKNPDGSNLTLDVKNLKENIIIDEDL